MRGWQGVVYKRGVPAVISLPLLSQKDALSLLQQIPQFSDTESEVSIREHRYCETVCKMYVF